jgi:hypothetical protein
LLPPNALSREVRWETVVLGLGSCCDAIGTAVPLLVAKNHAREGETGGRFLKERRTVYSLISTDWIRLRRELGAEKQARREGVRYCYRR